MLKNDFRLNLTSLIMLVGLVFLLITCIRQWSDIKDTKKAYDEKVAECAAWESNIIRVYEEEKSVLRDSVEYFRAVARLNKETANKQKRHVIKLQGELSTIEDEVKEMPSGESYTFLSGLYPSTGALEYPFAGNQVEEFHIDYLEGIKCTEITKSLELESKYLDLSLQASGEMNYKMQEELDVCDFAMAELDLKLQKESMENKKLKRKVWNNRSIAGFATVFAVIVLL